MITSSQVDWSDFRCLDCGIGTQPVQAGGISEYYMVYDTVWPLGTNDGMLCIGCLERRIGRRLTPADFTNYPINAGLRKSARLLDRLGRKPLAFLAEKG